MAPAVLDQPRNVKRSTPPPQMDSEALFEVIQGKQVELPNMSSHSNQISILIFIAIYEHVKKTGSGTAFIESLFGIPTKDDPNKQRRPDVAYVSKARWPLNKVAPDFDPWPVVPNLAVEVISPSDRIVEVNAKISDYFEAGVELVWVVHPRNEMVEVYTAPLQSTKLSRSETLTGGSVLLGFELKLATIFRSN
jgi:Uma2 family endonuclease